MPCRLKRLEDCSVDCVITDPPYFIDGMGSEWNDESLRSKAKKCGVIGALPVGMKFGRRQGAALQEFMNPIAEELYRVLRPGGFCVAFSQARLYHRMAMSFDLAGFEIRDMLAWKYEGAGEGVFARPFRRDKRLSEEEKEALLEELRDMKTPQLKPQIEPMVLAQKPKIGTFVENWQAYKLGLINTKERLDGKFPGNVMEVPKQSRKEDSKERIGHLMPKPTRLVSHLVRLFPREGQIVLDPFLGSGFHALAALREGRRFVGFETEKRYFDLAQKRIGIQSLEFGAKSLELRVDGAEQGVLS